MSANENTWKISKLSPDDGFYFFGYYDLQPFNESETLHLAHKPDFMDHIPVKGETCEFGVIEVDTKKYQPLGRTDAWNFQQGCMLQWNPKSPDREIIYNDYIDGDYVAVIMDIRTGAKRYVEKPVANVSRDGRYALSINFSRLYDFRPGYGYACEKDRFYDVNHPTDDGIWLVDMESGKSKLIVSLDQIWETTGKRFYDGERKMNINHITFNPSASRFFCLARNFRVDEKPHKTVALTFNRDGSDMYVLSDYNIMSHYYWINDEELILYGSMPELKCATGKPTNFFVKDRTHEGYIQDENAFERDNHMIFPPDMRCMIYDGYPDKKDGDEPLYIYYPDEKRHELIGRFHQYVDYVGNTDIRCDLHPRWNRSGTAVTFDSTHDNGRGIYMVEGFK